MHNSLPRTIDYIEMPSKDLPLTREFFTQLFGWSFQDYGPDYAAFDDGRMAGGFFAPKVTASVAAGAPLIVFYATELEKASAEVARLGGKIIREIFEFRGAGWRRICSLVGQVSSRKPPRSAGNSLPDTLGSGRCYEIIAEGKKGEEGMRLKERFEQMGAAGYILLWLLGIPIPILLLFFLLRGCT